MSYGAQDDGSYRRPPRIQDSLARILKRDMAFPGLAEEVLTGDRAKLIEAAQVIERNFPPGPRREQIIQALRDLRLI